MLQLQNAAICVIESIKKIANYSFWSFQKLSVKNLLLSIDFQEQELMKYLLESDEDNSGTLDFDEFKVAIKVAQRRLKDKELEDSN